MINSTLLDEGLYLINDAEELFEEVEAQLPGAEGCAHLDPYPRLLLRVGQQFHHTFKMGSF